MVCRGNVTGCLPTVRGRGLCSGLGLLGKAGGVAFWVTFLGYYSHSANNFQHVFFVATFPVHDCPFSPKGVKTFAPKSFRNKLKASGHC